MRDLQPLPIPQPLLGSLEKMAIDPELGFRIIGEPWVWFDTRNPGNFMVDACLPLGSEVVEHVVAEPRAAARFWWGGL